MATPSCDTTGVPREPIFEGDFSFNTNHRNYLSTTDYVVICTTLAISLTISSVTFWKQRHTKSIHEYALVSRSLSGVVASLSIGATTVSSLTTLALAGSVYIHNAMECWTLVPLLLVTIIANSVFVPVFYQLNVTSVFEYLELRFNRSVRLLGFLMYFIYSVIYMAIVLHSPGISFQSVTGIDPYYVSIAISVACVAYTTLGSTRGVVYTDVFEYSVMFVGIIIVLVKANSVVGGVSVMVESGRRTNRLLLDNFSPDPRDNDSFWAITTTYFQLVLFIFGVSQQTIHRCLSCKSLWDAKLALWINFFGIWLFFGLCIVLALYAGAFYENCDPMKAKLIENRLEFVPFFVLDTMSGSSGFVGAYIVVIMCATLSTFSSLMNTTAVVTLEDLFRVFSKSHIEEKKARRMIQVITVLFGFMCIEGAVAISKYKGNFFVISMVVLGTVSSSILALFLMGVLIPTVNNKGALCGLFGGLMFKLLVLVAKSGVKSPISHEAIRCISNCNITLFPHLNEREDAHIVPSKPVSALEYLRTISYRYSGPMSTLVAILFGVLASWCTGFQDPQQVEPVLLVSFVDEVFPFYYLPESFRRKCRFGIDHSYKWEKWSIKKEQDKFLTTDSRSASQDINDTWRRSIMK